MMIWDKNTLSAPKDGISSFLYIDIASVYFGLCGNYRPLARPEETQPCVGMLLVHNFVDRDVPSGHLVSPCSLFA